MFLMYVILPIRSMYGLFIPIYLPSISTIHVVRTYTSSMDPMDYMMIFETLTNYHQFSGDIFVFWG